MPLLGISGLALVILAIFLAATGGAPLFFWLIVLFCGITMLALSTATRRPK
jgi:hypothetical protein